MLRRNNRVHGAHRVPLCTSTEDIPDALSPLRLDASCGQPLAGSGQHGSNGVEQPGQSSFLYLPGEGRFGRPGSLRRPDPPLRQTRVRYPRRAVPRRTDRNHRRTRHPPPVLPSAAFRAQHFESARALSARTEDADRGTAVGPLCDPAARHGARIARRLRRLHHRLAGRARRAVERRQFRFA